MSRSTALVGLSIAVLLIDCGGRTTSDSSSATADTAVVNGGAGNTADQCLGGAADGGCGGDAGEHALEPYARLRTACRLPARVNRRGAPVSIDVCIR